MRILVICGAGYISGKEKVTLALLKGLRDSGHDVCCVISAWSNGDFAKRLAEENISCKKLRLGFMSKTLDRAAIKMTLLQGWYWPGLLWRYRSLVRKFKPDAVIHTNFHHLFLLFPALQIRRQTHFYHSHESIINSGFYRKLFKRFEKKISCFIGVSGFVTRRLADMGLKHTRTIYNGIDRIDPLLQEKADTGFAIGIVGQVGAWKGHRDLVEAVAILSRQSALPSFRVYIYGKGPADFIEELKKLIAEKGLEFRFVWKGYQNELAAIYSGLDVVCVPSRSEEPFGLSAVEPGLFSLPVVVSRRGGLPEIVHHGENGFIVEAGAPDQLAHYLAALMQDRGLALQMGQRHREIVLREFTNEKFISDWNTLLSDYSTGQTGHLKPVPVV